jgi:hypothetical protein
MLQFNVLNDVGSILVGDPADLARLAEDLRQTRFVLDQYCREIDQLLERIGFGDRDSESVESPPEDQPEDEG